MRIGRVRPENDPEVPRECLEILQRGEDHLEVSKSPVAIEKRYLVVPSVITIWIIYKVEDNP